MFSSTPSSFVQPVLVLEPGQSAQVQAQTGGSSLDCVSIQRRPSSTSCAPRWAGSLRPKCGAGVNQLQSSRTAVACARRRRRRLPSHDHPSNPRKDQAIRGKQKCSPNTSFCPVPACFPLRCLCGCLFFVVMGRLVLGGIHTNHPSDERLGSVECTCRRHFGQGNVPVSRPWKWKRVEEAWRGSHRSWWVGSLR